MPEATTLFTIYGYSSNRIKVTVVKKLRIEKLCLLLYGMNAVKMRNIKLKSRKYYKSASNAGKKFFV